MGVVAAANSGSTLRAVCRVTFGNPYQVSRLEFFEIVSVLSRVQGATVLMYRYGNATAERPSGDTVQSYELEN